MHDQAFRIAYLASADVRLAARLARESSDLRDLIQQLNDGLPRSADLSWQQLEELLRSDTTTATFAPGEGARHEFLWELKRECLALTLQCLPLALRLAFIVVDVCGLAPDVLGTTRKAIEIRLTRVRKRLEETVGNRCGHLNRAHPCSCKSRLGIAMRKDLLRKRLPLLECPRTPHDAHISRSVKALYKSLPIACPSILEGAPC